MSPTPTFPTDRLRVEPWDDPLVDRLGHDPRSTYTEHYWLGILGPSEVDGAVHDEFVVPHRGVESRKFGQGST